MFEPFDFLRFRMTRSRDMRAAGYRELFNNQASLPDQSTATNYWREATEVSDENRTERFGYVSVGNPDLKPEKSSTMTLGMVLSPGGWAQGMRFSVDYSDIKVKDGIYTPFSFDGGGAILRSCWELSGNTRQPWTTRASDSSCSTRIGRNASEITLRHQHGWQPQPAGRGLRQHAASA